MDRKGRTLLDRVIADLASDNPPIVEHLFDNSGSGAVAIPTDQLQVSARGQQYLVYFQLPFRASREALAAALCGAAEIACGICQKFPFQKENFNRFWGGFRPRNIFFDSREYAAADDDWSEVVFLGYLPDDSFREEDKTIVLFLGKLLVSAFRVERGSYVLGAEAIERFSASKAIAMSPDDSARVLKILRHAGTRTYH